MISAFGQLMFFFLVVKSVFSFLIYPVVLTLYYEYFHYMANFCPCCFAFNMPFDDEEDEESYLTEKLRSKIGGSLSAQSFQFQLFGAGGLL